MEKNIEQELKKLEKQGLSGIEVLALVSDSSYEVLFYAMYDGKFQQSNALVEEGKIDSDVVFSFYDGIAKAIRGSESFDKERMNIVIISDKKLTVAYDERKCKSYAIKKKWKLGIGV